MLVEVCSRAVVVCTRWNQLEYEWNVLDRDQNGALSRREVAALLKKLNCNIPRSEVRSSACQWATIYPRSPPRSPRCVSHGTAQGAVREV